MTELEKLRDLAISYKESVIKYEMLAMLDTPSDYSDRVKSLVELRIAQDSSWIAKDNLMHFIRYEFMENKSE